MLPVVILWPLIITNSASGEASTLNRPRFQRIRPWTGLIPGPSRTDLAMRAGPEQDRVVALQLDELDPTLTVVDFECGHASLVSSQWLVPSGREVRCADGGRAAIHPRPNYGPLARTLGPTRKASCAITLKS